VRWLQLDHNLLGDASAEALAVTLRSRRCSLESVDLDFNRIGDLGAKHLAAALEVNASLKELQLHCNAVAGIGAAALAQALRTNRTVHSLSLHGNRVQNDGAVKLAEALEANSTIKTLSLHGNGVGDIGASRLAKALQVNTTLSELALGFNEIGDPSCLDIGVMLGKNSTLRELHLDKNQVGDKGAKFLAEGLRQNRALRELWLVNNPITGSGITVLAEALEENDCLQRLGLTAEVGSSTRSGTPSTSADGSVVHSSPGSQETDSTGASNPEDGLQALRRCHAVRKAVKCVNDGQEEIDLAGTKLGDKGAKRLALAISRSNSIKGLGLEGCGIGDEGANCLAKALEQNHSLQQVSLTNNDIGDVGAERLAEALERNETVENVDLDGNPMSEEMSSRIATPRLSTPRCKGTWGGSSSASSRPAGPLHAQGPLDISRMNTAVAAAQANAARAQENQADEHGQWQEDGTWQEGGEEDYTQALDSAGTAAAESSRGRTRGGGRLESIDETKDEASAKKEAEEAGLEIDFGRMIDAVSAVAATPRIASSGSKTAAAKGVPKPPGRTAKVPPAAAPVS